MSILVLIQSSAGVIWYTINIQLAYLCIEVGLSVIYTILVTNRLLFMRGLMRQVMQEHEYYSIYDTSILMVIESAVLYSVCAIIFIVSFALHSNVSNLCFLSISHVQVSKQQSEPSVFLMRSWFGTRVLHNYSSLSV